MTPAMKVYGTWNKNLIRDQYNNECVKIIVYRLMFKLSAFESRRRIGNNILRQFYPSITDFVIIMRTGPGIRRFF